MKRSFYLVALQVLGLIVKLVSVMYIAGAVPPRVYSLLAINAVICSIVAGFGVVGLEQVVIRNALYWQKVGCFTKTKLYITQCVMSKCYVFLGLLPFLLGYCIYLANTKYPEDDFLMYSFLFVFSSLFSAIIGGNLLVLQALNRFVAARSISFFASVVFKIFGILCFLKYGFHSFLIVSICGPVLVSILTLFVLRKHLSLKYLFVPCFLWRTIKKAKHFTFSGYLNFLFMNIDSILVTVLFVPELIASYNIAKGLWGIGKTFVATIMDSFVQKLVFFKDDEHGFKNYMKKCVKVELFLLVLISAFFPILIIYIDGLLSFMKLSEYPHMEIFTISAYVCVILMTFLQRRKTSFSLFLNSKTILKVRFIEAVVSIILLLIFLLCFSGKFIWGYRIISTVIQIFLLVHYFNKIAIKK